MNHLWDTEATPQHAGLRYVRGKRVVTIGGGTGLFALLSTLKHYPCSITSIVTMTDSGGSSRRLMDEFGQLPLGDLRQALVALSRRGTLWRDVFTFRFRTRQQGGVPTGQCGDARTTGEATVYQPPSMGVGGHSLGNLVISALQDLNDGDLLRALEDAQELLDTAGNVLPVTLSRATLCAELATGDVIVGETTIDMRGSQQYELLPSIRRVFLREDPPACDEAIRAIQRADIIVVGPGDLYTSIVPNLLVRGVAHAIRVSKAQKIYIGNLMTKHGETDGFRASDFVYEVHRYLGDRVDRVILHDGSLPDHLLGLYASQHQHPVQPDIPRVQTLVPEVLVDQLLAIRQNQYVRHNADRLIKAIFLPPGSVTVPTLARTHSAEVRAPA